MKSDPSPTQTPGVNPGATSTGSSGAVGGAGGSTGGPTYNGSGGDAGAAGNALGYDGGFVWDTSQADAGPAVYDIVVGDTGWKWDVNCPASIQALCANGGTDTAPCVQNWSEAMKPSSWCAHPNINTVELLGSCNGYSVVGIFGSPPDHTGNEIFLYYFYDATTGGLVHVDSDAIPSFTHCAAGTSGSRFDTFGCQSTEINCR